jgi:hypothetical protein
MMSSARRNIAFSHSFINQRAGKAESGLQQSDLPTG